VPVYESTQLTCIYNAIVLEEIKETPARDDAAHEDARAAEHTNKKPIAKRSANTSGESSTMAVGLKIKFAGAKRKAQPQPTALTNGATTTRSDPFTPSTTTSSLSGLYGPSASSSTTAERGRRRRCKGEMSTYDDWMSPTWRSDSGEDSDVE
jgi:hypothetical protein